MNKWERIYIEREMKYKGVGVLKNYGTKTRGNQKFMKYACGKDIGALQYATEELRKKYDVIYAFLHNNPHNLENLINNFECFQTQQYVAILEVYKNPDFYMELPKDTFKNPRLLKACKISVNYFIQEQKKQAKLEGRVLTDSEIQKLNAYQAMISNDNKLAKQNDGSSQTALRTR